MADLVFLLLYFTHWYVYNYIQGGVEFSTFSNFEKTDKIQDGRYYRQFKQSTNAICYIIKADSLFLEKKVLSFVDLSLVYGESVCYGAETHCLGTHSSLSKGTSADNFCKVWDNNYTGQQEDS